MADVSGRSTFGVARFDDRRRGRSTVFRDLGAVISARTLDDVKSALARAEELARRGNWVYGFVSYEAAPAFDPALHVRAHTGAGSMPLCWFAAVPPDHVAHTMHRSTWPDAGRTVSATGAWPIPSSATRGP
ncbi:hypothetical protein [Nocardia carnea]|uniref:Uncharacterized protein n=1 Tax=Nocardia carnea TaxID=37328 RepID=A0ABW7TRA5_9NOCA|nr:hypothetical protein [Nocardia carnea]